MGAMTMDSEEVAGLPVFSGLGRQQLQHILTHARIERYPGGTLLFREGDRPEVLHAVINGTVEIYSNRSGREWGVMLMNSLDVLMPGAVLFDEPYTISARTVDFCRVLTIDAEHVRAEAERCPQFAMRLARAMAGQFRVTVRQILDLKSRNAAQRLASFLLKFADNSSAPMPELPMRKRNLAARIGMTPETLSRTLQVLADNGLVVRGRQVIVRDRDRIEHFCGPDPYRPRAEDSLQVHVL